MNVVKFIFDDQNKMITKAGDIAKVLLTHFEKNLYFLQPQKDIDGFLPCVEPLTHWYNDEGLTQPFTRT